MASKDRRAMPPVSPPASLLRSAQAVRRVIERAHRGAGLPLLTILEQTISMVEVHATAAFAELRIPEALADAPATSAEIADLVNADTTGIDRLLRFVVTRGLVKRSGDTWKLTAAGHLLREDHPDSVRAWVLFAGSGWQTAAWAHLADGIRNPDTTPYAIEHGAPFFDDLATNPDRGALFDGAMEATSRLQGDLLNRALDLDGVSTVCDVGGGTGSVLTRLLEAHPQLRGQLVELPDVIERARDLVDEAGLTSRIELTPGDMFAGIPDGADRYVLAAVVHDWADDDAVRILSNVGDALSAPGARAVVIELELPDHDGASLERSYDLLMLVLGGGRERTHDEFVALYDRAGLAIADDIVLGNGWHAHELIRS